MDPWDLSITPRASFIERCRTSVEGRAAADEDVMTWGPNANPSNQ